jgi:hypothetical protein
MFSSSDDATTHSSGRRNDNSRRGITEPTENTVGNNISLPSGTLDSITMEQDDFNRTIVEKEEEQGQTTTTTTTRQQQRPIITTNMSSTTQEIQMILEQYTNNEKKEMEERIFGKKFDDNENDNDYDNNNTINQHDHHRRRNSSSSSNSRPMMTSCQLIQAATNNKDNQHQNNHHQQQQQQHDEGDRFHRIKFKILRTQYSNQLAHKYYQKRQMCLYYLPLQILAMLSTIIGFSSCYTSSSSSRSSSTSSSPNEDGSISNDDDNDNDNDNGINYIALIEGIIGALMVFFTNLVRYISCIIKESNSTVLWDKLLLFHSFYTLIFYSHLIFYRFSFFFFLFLLFFSFLSHIYQGKNLDYDAKSKQHQLVAVQMKWLLDDLDMIDYSGQYNNKNGNGNNNNGNVSSDNGNGNDDGDINNNNGITNNNNGITNNVFEKIESTYFTTSQTVTRVVPNRIGLAYNKLEFQLRLMRVNKDSIYHHDDNVYYRVYEYAISELTVILGSRILFLPSPDVSVQNTLDRVKIMLQKGKQDCVCLEVA